MRRRTILSWCVGAILAMACPTGADTLSDLISQFETDMQRTDATSLNARAMEAWARRFEDAIAASPDAPMRYQATHILANLYMTTGNYDSAETVSRAIAESAAADVDVRINASFLAYKAAVAGNKPPAQSLSHLDRFQSLVDSRPGDGSQTTGSPSFEKPYERDRICADLYRSIVYEKYAATAASTLSGSQRHAALSEALTHAARYREQYVNTLASLPAHLVQHRDHLEHLNVAREGSLYKLGELYSRLALISQGQGDAAQADRYHRKSVEFLTAIFTENRMPKNSILAGTLLLSEQYVLRKSHEEFREFAANLLTMATPDEAYFVTLRNIANDLSQAVDVRSVAYVSDPRQTMELQHANRYIDLVLDTAQAWFPERYTQLVDYQWSLLIKIDNLLKMGRIHEAVQLLDLFRTIDIRGDALRKYYEGMLRRAGNAYGNIDRVIQDSLDDVPMTSHDPGAERDLAEDVRARSTVGAGQEAEPMRDADTGGGGTGQTRVVILIGIVCLTGVLATTIARRRRVEGESDRDVTGIAQNKEGDGDEA